MGLILLLTFAVIVLSFLTRRKHFPKLHGLYSQQGDSWYFVKLLTLWITLVVHKTFSCIHRRRHPEEEVKLHNINSPPNSDEEKSIHLVASDAKGNVLSVRFRRRFDQLADVCLVIRLADGTVLTHAECSAIDETLTADDAEEEYISASGLRIVVIDRMRTYRLLYSGTMQSQNINRQQERYTQVNLRIWFRALTDAADFTIDYSPFAIARCIAVEPDMLKFAYSKFLQPRISHTQQAGEMRGFLEVFGSRQELTLNGLKDHIAGQPSALVTQSNNGFVVFRVRFEGGLVFSLHLSSDKDGITHLTSGFAYFQTGFVYPVEWTDLHLLQFSTKNNLRQQFSFNIAAHGRIYQMRVEILSSSTFRLPECGAKSMASVIHENIIKVVMKGDQVQGENLGFGTLAVNVSGEQTQLHGRTISLSTTCQKRGPQEVVPLCVPLSDTICRHSSITGGKAASLADIVAVISQTGDIIADFKVPTGFAITVAAYEDHLKNAPTLSGAVRKVLEMSSNMNKGAEELDKLTVELEEACQTLHESFLATPLTKSLQDSIRRNMELTFGKDDWRTLFTAVRSSAVGEDGAEASGAGQMETFLGIQGLDKICEAVQLCWASRYSFRAVQYRRQLCATVDSPMAVLVQELVKADVAGVLFTRHPDTGSTAQSIINASYGIGEGVVSGRVQPDTISIFNEGPQSEEIRIVYDALGEKATAYKLNEEYGVVQEEQEVGKRHNVTCCLEESEIRRLHKIGKFVEQIYRSSRDIEFALKKDAAGTATTFFILQARPITTADMEDEWELLHELDTPLASDREWLTPANVQEIMPGALSPLSANYWVETISEGWQEPQSDFFLKARQRFLKSRFTPMCCQHVLMNWMVLSPALTNEFTKAAADMAFFGRKVDELTPEMFVEQNDVSSTLSKMLIKLYEWNQRYLPRKGMHAFTKAIDEWQVPAITDPGILFQEIRKQRSFCTKVACEHLRASAPAAIIPTIIMAIMDRTMKWGPQMYEDMATMLSSATDVYSADVPVLLQEVASSIRSDSQAGNVFLNLERTEATKWLLSSESGQAGRLFRAFIAKHGHRCVRDADIREKSWKQAPEKLVDAIKAMVINNATSTTHFKTHLSVDDALNAVKTPLTRLQRLVIKFLLPKARAAVGKREWTKSYAVKMAENYRQNVYRLATLLTERGFLPDVDLIFFLLPHEIERLVAKRSPKLIARALRRRKLFPKFENLQFPEIFGGHVEPVKRGGEDEFEVPAKDGEQIVIKGMAVGQGFINGSARVVKSLAEANQIKAGDILIVSCTDVGWTPYFPMISGLVTEMGGLISHGAVVAREYGLPCLVGCKRATDLIKTGDRVYIDGHKGEIRVTPINT